MDDIAPLLSFASCYSAPADLFDFNLLSQTDERGWDAAISEKRFEAPKERTAVNHNLNNPLPSINTFADYFINSCNSPELDSTRSEPPVDAHQVPDGSSTKLADVDNGTAANHSRGPVFSDRTSDLTSEADNSNSSRSSPARMQGSDRSDSVCADPPSVSSSYADILKNKNTASAPSKSSPVRCTFSITNEKKQSAPPAEKSKKATAYKSVLCSKFSETGRCPYGVNCLYAHGSHELKKSTTSKPRESLTEKEQGRLFKTKLCRVFSDKGSCPYGKTCVYAHGKHELREATIGPVTILKRKAAK